jgi:hypothetical protein
MITPKATLESLLNSRSIEELRELALTHIHKVMDCYDVNDEFQVFLSDALDAWTHWPVDETLILHFGKMVKHLLPK